MLIKPQILDVLTVSTEINFQKDMGADMMHLPYSCLCFCESFVLEVRINRSTVKIVSFFNSQDNAVKQVKSPCHAFRKAIG